ncbi:MAG TPA: anhydro-N-acetylmuramic acid kinase [Saprospiraceae bacterium]|nr:anhydro-N-acetylmuramic acid kinase [Saprospiraceae bacterium]
MPTRIIGIMSGSSLDGLDMALCTFEATDPQVTWKILEAQTVSYSPEWQSNLKRAAQGSGFELMKLDADFGKFIGTQVRQWMEEKHLAVDFVASHGHTVFHEPGLHFTTQIGSGAQIASITQLDTITDFRSADVAHGGQGAPLAPIADRELFSGYDGYLNLGGIANISIRINETTWKARDIGPCNQALNFLSEKIGKTYDQDGKIAATGQCLSSVQSDLVNYFHPHGETPKSLSNQTIASTWISYLAQSKYPVADLMRSVAEAISDLIIDHIIAMIPSPLRILVTGGGAHNSFLFQSLAQKGIPHHIQFEKPDSLIIDYKESLLLAYLGWLNLHGRAFRIHDLTGSTMDSIGGAYYKASR